MGKPTEKPESKHPIKPHPIEDLIRVMAKLRDPDGGCPWDLEQDYGTIAPYTIEEAYEVADAIERGDMKDLREELGDLILQPIYHAQMAAEAGHFDIYDVIRDVTQKMITRHPHVFGDTAAKTASDVNAIWDERKNAEKEKKSALDGVAKALPALLRAQKLQNRAAKVGFEWDKLDSVLDKLEEELAEMREALKNGTLAQKTDELGDILFVVANLARMQDINPETALRLCNDKFERRFKGMEDAFKAKNEEIKDASLTEMEEMWCAQKRKEAKL
jgi:nucleoside triphosphate diphosphatase